MTIPVCRYIREEEVRRIPCTYTRMMYEQRVREVPVRVCKMVPVKRKIRMPRSVQRMVPAKKTVSMPQLIVLRQKLHGRQWNQMLMAQCRFFSAGRAKWYDERIDPEANYRTREEFEASPNHRGVEWAYDKKRPIRCRRDPSRESETHV